MIDAFFVFYFRRGVTEDEKKAPWPGSHTLRFNSKVAQRAIKFQFTLKLFFYKEMKLQLPFTPPLF